jgi:hypothetical protein
MTEAQAAINRMHAIREALPSLSADRRRRVIEKLVALVTEIAADGGADDGDDAFAFLAYMLRAPDQFGRA